MYPFRIDDKLLTFTAKDVADPEARIHEARDFDVEKEEDSEVELPLDIDLKEIQLADQYQVFRLPQDDEERVPLTIDFDHIDDFQTTEEFFNPMPPPQPRRFSQNPSEELPHSRIRDEDPDPFILALGL